MALSQQEKEALADHYRGQDLYDPSKDPKQEPTTFTPQGLWGGGCAGMADGGTVMDTPGFDASLPAELQYRPESPDGQPVNDISLAGLAADPSIAQTLEHSLGGAPQPPAAAPAPLPQKPPMLAAQPAAVEAPPPVPIAAPGAIPAAAAAPARPGKLSPDQFDELVNGLRPSTGQGAMSGLAGLADAIMQGVARAGPGQFQKNIQETQQQRQQNLINALKAKYETQFKGAELGQGAERIAEETRSHKANEVETKRARELTERGQNLGAKQHADQLKYEQGKESREAQQKQNEDDMKIVQEYSPMKPGGYSAQQRDAAAARLRAHGIGAAAAPMTATNKATGQKIVSHDGGKTWQKTQ